MKTWNILRIDGKDIKIFSIMGSLIIVVYLYTGSSLIATNGVVSFFFTFIPARLERLKKN